MESLINKKLVPDSGFIINEPIHVHGYHNNRMIFGVNDISQISNEELCKDPYALNTLVKTYTNRSYGVYHTNKCLENIHKAHLLCCYGLSFGETDKFWWTRICEELKQRNNLIVILFQYEKDMPDYSNAGPKLQLKRDEIVTSFLNKGEVENSLQKELKKRVFVSFNPKLFNFKIEVFPPTLSESLGTKSFSGSEYSKDPLDLIRLKRK